MYVSSGSKRVVGKVIDSIFINNRLLQGGAIMVQNIDHLKIQNTQFIQNQAITNIK